MQFISAGGHPGDNDPEPSAEQVQAWHRTLGPPDNELPGAIPFHAALARTDDLVVGLVGASAYSNGMSIKIAIRLRRRDPSLHGFGDLHPHNPGGGILVGVAYSDGRTASNVRGRPFPDPSEIARTEPLLMDHDGGGDDRAYDQNYWLTPMPPPGDLTIIIAWPTRDIPESRTVIPADAIAQGASANVELWPWQPPEDDEPPPPPPKPTLPKGGWFDQHT